MITFDQMFDTDHPIIPDEAVEVAEYFADRGNAVNKIVEAQAYALAKGVSLSDVMFALHVYIDIGTDLLLSRGMTMEDVGAIHSSFHDACLEINQDSTMVMSQRVIEAQGKKKMLFDIVTNSSSPSEAIQSLLELVESSSDFPPELLNILEQAQEQSETKYVKIAQLFDTDPEYGSKLLEDDLPSHFVKEIKQASERIEDALGKSREWLVRSVTTTKALRDIGEDAPEKMGVFIHVTIVNVEDSSEKLSTIMMLDCIENLDHYRDSHAGALLDMADAHIEHIQSF